MKNKVLVKIKVLNIDKDFDVFLPINKTIGNIILLIVKTINDMENYDVSLSSECSLYNCLTGEICDPKVLIKDSSICNGSVLVLI